MKRITPTQRLTLFSLAALMVANLLFRNQIPLWRSQLFFYAILLGLLFVVRISSERRGSGETGGALSDFSPVVFILSIYQSLGNMIQHLKPDIDSSLIQIDLFLFGVHPTVWMEKWITPWFTDIMSLAYVSYYFVPVTLLLILYLRGKREDFGQTMFILTFGYYLSFVGYIFFPAIGPRFTQAHLYSVPLEGSFFTGFVRDALNALEHNKRDCMPSGHTQIAFMVLLLSRRQGKALFAIFLPIVLGLVLSTVYLRYHYVIDLVAGVAFAAGSLVFAPRLYRWLSSTK